MAYIERNKMKTQIFTCSECDEGDGRFYPCRFTITSDFGVSTPIRCPMSGREVGWKKRIKKV
jgi:hypothetical protein